MSISFQAFYLDHVATLKESVLRRYKPLLWSFQEWDIHKERCMQFHFICLSNWRQFAGLWVLIIL